MISILVAISSAIFILGTNLARELLPINAEEAQRAGVGICILQNSRKKVRAKVRIIVIGRGPGIYVAAITAAKLWLYMPQREMHPDEGVSAYH